jgi:hypothetical protein
VRAKELARALDRGDVTTFSATRLAKSFCRRLHCAQRELGRQDTGVGNWFESPSDTTSAQVRASGQNMAVMPL